MYKKVIDMTHTINNEMYIWPGQVISPDAVQKLYFHDTPGYEYEATMLHFSTHTGTHMDCNSHTNNINGQEVYFVDTKDPAFFIGSGKVVNCVGKASVTEKNEIGMDVLDGVDLDGVDFLFFYLDWDKKWGTRDYWLRYPNFSKELAHFLADHPTVRGVGLETPGCDPTEVEDLTIHKIYLAKDKTIFECVTNLDQLLDKSFTFIGLPLKIGGAEGSPIRAIAVLDD